MKRRYAEGGLVAIREGFFLVTLRLGMSKIGYLLR